MSRCRCWLGDRPHPINYGVLGNDCEKVGKRMQVFQSGAKSTEKKPRYDLLPLEGVRRGARRMAEGAASHGDRNFERGAADPDFVRDRINHLIEHAILYSQGDRSTDHLGAVIANACMLARLEVLRDSQG